VAGFASILGRIVMSETVTAGIVHLLLLLFLLAIFCLVETSITHTI
jgi:hypothetical protein